MIVIDYCCYRTKQRFIPEFEKEKLIRAFLSRSVSLRAEEKCSSG